MSKSRIAALSAIALALACGTASHPSTFDPSVDAGGEGGGSGADGGPLFGEAGVGPNDPYYDCQPVDAGPGSCPCRFPYKGGITVLACNAGLCSDILNDSYYCTADGHLVVLSSCYLDGSAGEVPPCAPGTHPTPPR